MRAIIRPLPPLVVERCWEEAAPEVRREVALLEALLEVARREEELEADLEPRGVDVEEDEVVIGERREEVEEVPLGVVRGEHRVVVVEEEEEGRRLIDR